MKKSQFFKNTKNFQKSQKMNLILFLAWVATDYGTYLFENKSVMNVY